MSTNERPAMSCDTCKLRKHAETKPTSLLGRLWTWHTAYCPGWKRYLKNLQAHGEQPPSVGNQRGIWKKL